MSNIKHYLDIDPFYLYEILDSIEDGIYITDQYGNTLWNNRSSKIWLAKFGTEVWGRNVAELEREGIFQPSIIKRTLEAGKRVTAIQHINGVKFISTGHLIYNQMKELQYVIAHTRDLSHVGKSVPNMELEQINSILQRYIQEFRKLNMKQSLNQHENPFIGQSKYHSRLSEMIETVSSVDSTVLITGETGVGKNVVAQQIHSMSDRFKKAFIHVNCASIPQSLIESELFGYKKGAFTGASNSKAGLVKLAEGGTLFLDEISEIPLHLQSKLLQLLQNKTYMAIGDSQMQKADIRIIAASNLNLEDQVKKGMFRADLFYRINILPIHVLPLRERKEDIFPLLQYYLNLFNVRNKKERFFSKQVIEILQKYSWPGNIRELENLVEQLVILAKENEIKDTDLPERLYQEEDEKELRLIIPSNSSLLEILNNVEKKVIERAYKEHKTTRKAAKELGITQSLLVRRLAKYGIKKGDKKN